MKNLLLAATVLLGLPSAVCAQGYNRPTFGDVRIPALGANPSVLAAIQALRNQPVATGSGAPGPAGATGPVGAVGPQGPAGQGFNYRGAWAANTQYNPYDVVSYGGSTYIATTAFTSGATFSTAGLSMVAAAGTAPAFTATATGLAAGASPTITVGGTNTNPTLAFGIPAGTKGATGATGATPAISVSSTALPSNSSPTVSQNGTTAAPVLTFGIPAGSGAGCTFATGAITAPGCYIYKLYGTTTSTTPLRLTTDGSGVPNSTNTLNMPAGYSINVLINGGAHDPTDTASYFPSFLLDLTREIQRNDAGAISIITGGGYVGNASGYNLGVNVDSTNYGINVTAIAGNADTTKWVVWLTVQTFN